MLLRSQVRPRPRPEDAQQPQPQRPGKDTIVCLSEGDFCLSFSSFSSCLISFFWTRLNFLISAYKREEGCFLDVRGPRPARQGPPLTRVCLMWAP